MEDATVTSVELEYSDVWEFQSVNWTLATPGLGALEPWQTAGLAVLAAGVSLVTICGNLIVLLSFMLERSIRQPSNYFIASLAVSDLLIGTFSMPLYTVYILSVKTWPLGEILCDLWLSLDYTACLCSIYTVFCITVDRFCSIRFPARYRMWRTERKVLIVVFMTWAIPISVFFTSIIGWQYFAGRRTVPAGKCYVQYMEDAVFNCILQVGYFWITLTAMILLYTGIYRVALDLHRRSEEKRRKQVTSLAAMAQHTVSHLGTAVVGITRTAKLDAQLIQQQQLQQQQQQQLQIQRQQRLQCIFGGDSDGSRSQQRGRSRSIVGPAADVDSTYSGPSSPSDSDSSTLHHADWLLPKPAARQHHDRDHPRKYKKSPVERHALRRSVQSSKPAAANSQAKDNQNTTTGDVRQPQCEDVQPHGVGPRSAAAGHLHDDRKITWYVDEPDMSSHGQTGGDVNIAVYERSSKHDEQTCDAERRTELPILAPMKHDEQTCDAERRTELPILAPVKPDEQTCDAERRTELPIPAHRRRRASWPPNAADAARSSRVKSRHCSRRPSPSIVVATAVVEPEPETCRTRPEVDRCATDDSGVVDDQLLHVHPVHAERLAVTKVKETSLYRSTGNIAVVSSDTCTVEPSSSTKETTVDNNGGITAGHPGIYKKAVVPEGRARQWQLGHAAAEKLSPEPSTPSAASAMSASTSLPKITASAFWDMIVGRGVRASALSESERRRRKLQKKNENRARKALRTITIILGAFVLCWTPWHVLSLLIGFCGTGVEGSDSCVPTLLYDISYWLCYLNSPINPFCYAFVNQQFKKTFIRILRLDWRRK